MKTDKFKTDVIFLIPLDEDFKEQIFAYFPKETFGTDYKVKNSYAHIGQHSACHVDYAKECKEANFNQYQDLKRELESIGYNLNILNQ